jgi:hypothetical protein
MVFAQKRLLNSNYCMKNQFISDEDISNIVDMEFQELLDYEKFLDGHIDIHRIRITSFACKDKSSSISPRHIQQLLLLETLVNGLKDPETRVNSYSQLLSSGVLGVRIALKRIPLYYTQLSTNRRKDLKDIYKCYSTEQYWNRRAFLVRVYKGYISKAKKNLLVGVLKEYICTIND